MRKKRAKPLTTAQCETIRILYVDGRTRDARPDRTETALAKMFGVHPKVISRIVNGKATKP